MKDKHELNEETSLWNAFREEGRKRTIKRQNDAKELCELLCGELGINFQFIHLWHFRLSQNGFKVDIFPTRHRYHIINSNQRGRYKDLQGFIYSKFK